MKLCEKKNTIQMKSKLHIHTQDVCSGLINYFVLALKYLESKMKCI